MSDERTEKATPKRRAKARSDGQVSKSQDLSSSVTLLVGLYVLFMYMPFIFDRFKTISITIFTDLNPDLITKANIWAFLGKYINEIFVILMPIMAVMVAAGIAINYYQVGPLFSMKAIQPDPSKLSPSKMIMGFKKFFQLKSFVEFLKSLLKLIIISGVGFSVIDKHKYELIALLGAEAEPGMVVLGQITIELITQICIVLLILGIIDKKYQDYEYEKSIKMTKHEIKDERKNAEGDPKIKRHIRKAQMQFAMQRMAGAIPTADVIIANPTHYAVALRYDTSKAPAPQVVAKGVDYVAFKIREIAEANNIPVVENPPLARTLYKIVPLDGMVPAELYVAVAEVLAFVYRTSKGKRK
ncbi:MAG TPA: flagellar biosynthesis protein FlhB [Candidatus Gastranaerophilales bacterium]|nr:flagellar biosynthesis protein FlhB [Candidatus Gastranaerophilales bacterium]